MKYGIALKNKYGVDGLTLNDTIELFDMLDNEKAFPIELQAIEKETSAMGFISPEAAKVLEYDYEHSGLHTFVANILDETIEKTEKNNYEFKGVKIYLGD